MTPKQDGFRMLIGGNSEVVFIKKCVIMAQIVVFHKEASAAFEYVDRYVQYTPAKFKSSSSSLVIYTHYSAE